MKGITLEGLLKDGKVSREEPLLKKFFSSHRKYSFATEFITQFTKQSANPKEFKPQRYSISLSYGTGLKERKLWHDSRYSFVLRYKRFLRGRKTIATISFEDHEYSNDALLVKQIQGVENQKRYLQPIKWERMLLNLVINWGRQNGYKSIKVLPSKMSTWNSIRNTDHGKMLYDVTAKRCGFKMDEYGYFSKDLN